MCHNTSRQSAEIKQLTCDGVTFESSAFLLATSRTPSLFASIALTYTNFYHTQNLTAFAEYMV
jgi:hypothetical protein